MNFIDWNIFLVYIKRIIVGKFFFLKNKKIRWHVIYTNRINHVGKIIGKMFTSPWHCLSCQLQREFSREHWNYSLSNCIINYYSLQTKSLTNWKVIGVIWRVSENFWVNWKFKLNITDEITDGLKSRWWYLAVSENFWLNWKFKLNITDGIIDEMIINVNI